MYYRGEPDELTLYAESKDGVHFERPKLGIFENNVIYKGIESHAFAPFRDANPQATPEQKYKALAYHSQKKGGGLVALASADALHWSKMQEAPVTTRGQFDSLNTVSWDPIEKRYRCFSRYWNAGAFKGVRAIQSSTSDDFLNWAEPVANQYADGVPLEHFYTNAAVRCPGAEHVWLSFPKRFIPDRKKVDSHPEKGVSDAVFMSSYDGEHWDRTFLEAWLRPGPDKRNWTERGTMTAWGIIETSPTEFSLYVSEHYRWPDNRLRRVTVRKHGFASVHASANAGEFLTKPLKFKGDALLLNYATSAAGSIQVELQDESGAVIPGFALADTQPIYGDELDHAVDWRGSSSIAALQGRTIRMRFVMIDADLFALRTK
jgi:hypothetical protein